MSLSENKSPSDIKFNIFLHPARSDSDSPDIFDGENQIFKLLFGHSCPPTKLSAKEQVSAKKRSAQRRGCYATTERRP